MFSRAAKYLVPIGGTAFLMPNAVFAAGRSSPSCVYTEPKKDPCDCPNTASESDCNDTELERLVMKCRQELGPLKDITACYTAQASEIADEYYKKLMSNMCYLRTKAPHEVRIGTIVASGLIGMMLGFRRGLTRKLFMGGLGAAGASYAVYPKESVYYARNGFSIVKKNANIGYNFVMGVPNSPKDCCRSDAPAAKLKAQKTEQNIKSR